MKRMNGHAAKDLPIQPHIEATIYFDAWSRSFPVPTIMMKPDLELIWRNGAAMEMLNDGGAFTEAGGALQCSDRVQAAELRKFLKVLAEPDAFIYQADGAFWVLRADPLEPVGVDAAAAVMFYCYLPTTNYLWADFGKVFGLTRAETQVVKGLIAGYTAEELAETQQVSVETIRTHIKRTYGKLGVNNREKMFSLLNQFRLV